MSTEEITSIKESLARIEKAIAGDPSMGHTGIAGRLEKVEQLAEANDRKLLKWGGVIVGAGLVLEHLKAKILG
jgi:hypothetical protein